MLDATVGSLARPELADFLSSRRTSPIVVRAFEPKLITSGAGRVQPDEKHEDIRGQVARYRDLREYNRTLCAARRSQPHHRERSPWYGMLTSSRFLGESGAILKRSCHDSRLEYSRLRRIERDRDGKAMGKATSESLTLDFDRRVMLQFRAV